MRWVGPLDRSRGFSLLGEVFEIRFENLSLTLSISLLVLVGV
jgi:hypothetical protein